MFCSAGIYLFKLNRIDKYYVQVNNKDTWTASFDVFLVSFMFTNFTPCSSVSMAEFEQVNP